MCQDNDDQHRIDSNGTSEVSEDLGFGIGITCTFRHLSQSRICISDKVFSRAILTPSTPSSLREPESVEVSAVFNATVALVDSR